MLYEGTNPVRNVEFPKQNNARERILWKHEEAVLWPALERYPNAHDAALLSRRTGMRRGEIVSLRVEHVDIHSGALRLMDTKNGSNRTVFATDEDLLSILRRRVLCAQEMGTPWLFPNAQGDAPIAANQISKRFKVVVDDLGLNDGIADRRLQLVFHCLRHTFGTEMIIKGMSLLTLKRIMGHKILSTTERYVHIAEELQKQQAMQAIAQDGWGISMDVAQD
jgi:integrase